MWETFSQAGKDWLCLAYRENLGRGSAQADKDFAKARRLRPLVGHVGEP